MSASAHKLTGTVQEKVGRAIGSEQMRTEGEAKKVEADIEKEHKRAGTTRAAGVSGDQVIGGEKQRAGAERNNPELVERGREQAARGARAESQFSDNREQRRTAGVHSHADDGIGGEGQRGRGLSSADPAYGHAGGRESGVGYSAYPAGQQGTTAGGTRQEQYDPTPAGAHTYEPTTGGAATTGAATTGGATTGGAGTYGHGPTYGQRVHDTKERVVGATKENVGRATGNPRREAEGRARRDAAHQEYTTGRGAADQGYADDQQQI